MSNPRTPAQQPYYGPMYGDRMAQASMLEGGPNPDTVATMRKNYGRYLAGFGGESPSGAVGYDPRYQGQEIYDLEGQDDTYGSGIFDPAGRAGTSNPNMGVFASHDSLPGYIAREVPFTVSRDVTDITDNADVVIVPGGGMAYVEQRGKLTGPAIMGPTWRPPQIEPAGWTHRDQVYAFENRGNQKGHYLNPNAPVTGPPRFGPDRPEAQAQPVPMSPNWQPMPMRPQFERVPKRSIVDATQTPVPIEDYADPVAPSAPSMPMFPGVPLRNTFNVATQQIAIDGLGAEESEKSSMSTAKLLGAGVIFGAAAGFIYKKYLK